MTWCRLQSQVKGIFSNDFPKFFNPKCHFRARTNIGKNTWGFSNFHLAIKHHVCFGAKIWWRPRKKSFYNKNSKNFISLVVFFSDLSVLFLFPCKKADNRENRKANIPLFSLSGQIFWTSVNRNGKGEDFFLERAGYFRELKRPSSVFAMNSQVMLRLLTGLLSRKHPTYTQVLGKRLHCCKGTRKSKKWNF